MKYWKRQKECPKSGQETGGSHSKNLNGERACMPDSVDLLRGVPYSSAVFLTVPEAVKQKHRGQLCHI
jgi:hypothetical protein